MRALTMFILISLAGLIPLRLDATTYYVAANGNDAAPGTITSPWSSLQRASSGLQPGDVVLVRSGVYHERFQPSESGSAGAPIVYRAYPGEYVEIDGLSDGELNVVSIFASYIVMEGFTIRNQNYFRNLGATTYWVALEGTNITFRKNRVFTDGDVWDNIYARNAMSRGIVVSGNSNTVEQCYVRGQVFGIVLAGPSPRNTIIRQDTVHAVGQNCIDVTSTEDGSTAYHNTLIEYCVLDTSFVEDNIQFEPNYADKNTPMYNRGTIIRFNRMGNAAENAIDLKGAGHTIIENNLIYGSNGDDDGPLNGPDASSGTGIETETVGSPTRYTIVRNNLIYDHSSGVTLAEGDHYYNNTILNNRRNWQGPNQTDSYHTNVRSWTMPDYKRAFINNIVGGMPNGSQVQFLMDWGSNFAMDHNLYYESTGPATFSHRINGSIDMVSGFAAWKSIMGNEGAYGYVQGKEQNSLEANPLFVNGPDYPTGFDPAWDYHLKAGSPAIDAGGPVTTAVQAGSASTTLTVDDAYFFCDGFARVEGDEITIGAAAPARILSIDYNTNVITLDGPRSWAAGDGVSLTFNGSATDIGANEFGSGASLTLGTMQALPGVLPEDGGNVTLQWTSNGAQSATMDNGVGKVPTHGTMTVHVAHSTIFSLVLTSGTGSQTLTVRIRVKDSPTPWSTDFVDPANGSSVAASSIRITWKSVSGAKSYTLQLATDSAFSRKLVDSVLTDTTFLAGPLAGNTRYYRRISAHGPAGGNEFGDISNFSTGTPGSESSAPGEKPAAFALGQNYPNPFNPSTKIQLTIVDRLLTIVKVYDVLGREVSTLMNEVKDPGTYTVQFNAAGFASGLYFYRIEAGTFHETKKMTLVK